MNTTMEFLEFEESMKQDGKISKDLNEHIMICFSSERAVYYTDDRNIRMDNGEIMVKTIGEDSQGYLHYVCPACGHIHYIHKSNVGRLRRIRCHCTKYPVLDDTGKIQRQKPLYIYLDASETSAKV